MILSTIYRHSSLSDLDAVAITYGGWRVSLDGGCFFRSLRDEEGAGLVRNGSKLLPPPVIRFEMSFLAVVM